MRSGEVTMRQRGFGYLLVLFMVAALGLMLARAGKVWHTTAQREREAELLFIGNQFRRAITSYVESSPAAARQYPARLEDLLDDKRSGVSKRHLRRIYADPMTGAAQWGLVQASGRISGVHSLAQGQPLKTSFGERDAAFSEATRYDQWVFSLDPTGTTPP
mgnify:CR=1 FL=1